MRGQTTRFVLSALALSLLVGVGQSHACIFGQGRARHRAERRANYQQPACGSCAPVAAPRTAFQVPACNSCGPQLAAAPASIAVPTTRMEARTAMVSVPTMETRTYVEPVVSYQTSYYYEPVTTFRTSSYYDPCSCSYQNVTQPVQTQVRREVVTPVTNMVTRTVQVPGTRVEARTYFEPVTSVQYYVPATQPVLAAAVPVVPAQPVVPVAPAVPGAVAPQPGYQGYWAPQGTGSQFLSDGAQPRGYQNPNDDPRYERQPPAGYDRGQQAGYDRNYQNPGNGGTASSGSSQGTWLEERVIKDGRLLERRERWIDPSQPIPAPRNPNEPSTSKSSWDVPVDQPGRVSADQPGRLPDLGRAPGFTGPAAGR